MKQSIQSLGHFVLFLHPTDSLFGTLCPWWQLKWMCRLHDLEIPPEVIVICKNVLAWSSASLQRACKLQVFLRSEAQHVAPRQVFVQLSSRTVSLSTMTASSFEGLRNTKDVSYKSNYHAQRGGESCKQIGNYSKWQNRFREITQKFWKNNNWSYELSRRVYHKAVKAEERRREVRAGEEGEKTECTVKKKRKIKHSNAIKNIIALLWVSEVKESFAVTVINSQENQPETQVRKPLTSRSDGWWLAGIAI